MYFKLSHLLNLVPLCWYLLKKLPFFFLQEIGSEDHVLIQEAKASNLLKLKKLKNYIWTSKARDPQLWVWLTPRLRCCIVWLLNKLTR